MTTWSIEEHELRADSRRPGWAYAEGLLLALQAEGIIGELRVFRWVGAAADARGPGGTTAIDVAESYGFVEVAEKLRSRARRHLEPQ